MSYQEAYKVIKPHLVAVVIFDVCSNDCILFKGEFKDSVTCPKCNESRFKAGNIPRRRFHYQPVGPRLVLNFGTSNISFILQSHAVERNTLENVVPCVTYKIPQYGKKPIVLLELSRGIHVVLGCPFVLIG